MISRSCIVIVCNVPWNWTTDYINQTATELSKKNIVLCLFWWDAKSIREHVVSGRSYVPFYRISRNIYGVYGLQILPFRRFRLIERANLRINVWCIRLCVAVLRMTGRIGRTVVWFFDPRLWKVAEAFGSGYVSVYDCVDYYSKDLRHPPHQRKDVQEAESGAFAGASVVSVNSRTLYAAHRRRRADLILAPQGFRLDSFRKHVRQRALLAAGLPIAGFVGALNDRIDYVLLSEVAKRMQTIRFVLVGPDVDVVALESRQNKARKELFALPNVTRILRADKADIPGIVRRFSVGIIPYRGDNPYATHSYPMKILEYWYFGLPVVSTPIKELAAYPQFVKIGSCVADWRKLLREALVSPPSAETRRKMRSLAVMNSWERKIAVISRGIESVEGQKARSRS